MTQSANWQLPNATSTAEVLDALTPSFELQKGTTSRMQRQVLDGFLQPIWHSGGLLFSDPSGWHLLLPDGRTLRQTVPDSVRFWWDLPDGPMRRTLRKLLGYWSIAPLHLLQLEETTLELRNEDEKIVLRATLRRWQLTDQDCCVLELKPLRGYNAEYQTVQQRLQMLGARNAARTDMRAILQAQGFAPCQFNLKGPYGLDAKQPAELAVRRMAVAMFDQARVFEPGIIEDRDSEFVHQYRVSLRKLRSLISLMKTVLPDDEAQQLKNRLSQLASTTGALRDLDVFLLEQEDYQALLPGAYRNGFAQLIATVQKDRKRALRAVQRSLQSERYAKACSKLRSRLDREPVGNSTHGDKPIRSLASKKILRRYERIRSAAALIEAHSPDDDVHEIRIECKKLRYMLEFFAELYPGKHIKPLLSALKSLQDLLGQFNDFAVQQLFLDDYANQGSPQQAAAVHGLIAVLNQKQKHTRTQVQSALDAFFSEEIADGVKLLFGKYV